MRPPAILDSRRETIELIRKLCLTSILALIAPGSAGQVVSGLLIAFFMLTLNLRLKPWCNDDLNFINTVAQVNLFFLLLVALLLKVNLDGTGGSAYFSGIVGALMIVPIALPVFIKLWLKVFGTMQSRLSVKETTWATPK